MVMFVASGWDDEEEIKVVPPVECVIQCEAVAKHHGTKIYERLKRRFRTHTVVQMVDSIVAGNLEVLPVNVRKEQINIVSVLEREFFCNVAPEQRQLVRENLSALYWQAIQAQMLLMAIKEGLK